MSKTPLPPNYDEPFKEAVANMTAATSKYSADYLFYLHILGQCKVIYDADLPAPAAMNFMYDHYCIYINPLVTIPIEPNPDGNYPKDKHGNEIKSTPGFNGLSLEHRLGVIKHEILHILHNHIGRRQERNHEGFNIAADCAINQQIVKSHLPEECIFPENLPVAPGKVAAPNLTAEQYYSLLNFSEDGSGSGSGGACSFGPPPPGDHSKWDDSKGDQGLAKDIAKTLVEKAINQTQKSRGNLPVDIDQVLTLLTTTREVDWRNVLRKFAGSKPSNIRRSYLRSDRRQPHMAHIKGRVKDRICEIAIIGDESGSVSDKELSEALSECRNICKTLGTPVWYVPVDTQAHEPHRLTASARSFKRVACGGTVLAPALDKLYEKKIAFNALVVITDGGIRDSDIDHFATSKRPTIWLITSNGEIPKHISSYPSMKVFKLKAPKS